MQRRFVLTVGLAIWIVARAAAAELIAVRPEFQVSTLDYYAHDEGRGSVATAASASGNFVVVWDDDDFSSGYYGPGPGIKMRRFDNLGRPLAPESRVSEPGSSPYGAGSAAVASAPGGQFVVVWDNFSYASSANEVLARRYTATGQAEGPPFVVNTTTSDQVGPKVAIDAAGGFFVVWWADQVVPGGPESVQGRLFDSSGAPLGDQFQVNSTACYGCAYSVYGRGALDVAVNGGGNFMVVWTGAATGSPSADGDVRARVFGSGGLPAGPDFVVNTNAERRERLPSVAADGLGRFVVTWLDGSDGSFGEHVFARRFDSAGGALGGAFQVSASLVPTYGSYSYGTDVAAEDSGRFVVTWHEPQPPGLIHAREFDSAGTAVAEPFRVDSVDDYYDFSIGPHGVAATPAGQFLVVWGQFHESPSGDAFAVGGRQIGEVPVACTPAPKAGCRQPTVPGWGVFRFRSSSANPQLIWRWVKGQEVTAEHLGDPRTTNSIAFCVYDGSAQAQPLMDLRVPAGGGCSERFPCWVETQSAALRFDYRDPERFVGGLQRIQLSGKPEGRAWATLWARGENLTTLPATPLTPPVTVQLQAANGTCWTAEYSSRIRKNEDGVFRAQPGA